MSSGRGKSGVFPRKYSIFVCWQVSSVVVRVSTFLEIGGAVFNTLSYQLTRTHHLACRGLFVATSGMFNWSSTSRNFLVLTKLDGREIKYFGPEPRSPWRKTTRTIQHLIKPKQTGYGIPKPSRARRRLCFGL